MLDSADHIVTIDEPNADYLALLGTSGLTAAIGLSESANIKAGDKVLITAASGGLGHLAAQYAKIKGCKVIALTSTEEKANFLRKFNYERIINYRKEDLSRVLTDEYPVSINFIVSLQHVIHSIALCSNSIKHTEWHRRHLGNDWLASL